MAVSRLTREIPEYIREDREKNLGGQQLYIVAGFTVIAIIGAFLYIARAGLGDMQRLLHAFAAVEGESNGPRITGPRLGFAADAGLLDVCFKPAPVIGSASYGMPPRKILALIRSSGRQDSLLSLLWGSPSSTLAEEPDIRGPILACLLAGRSRALCDPDNRALALEMIDQYARHVTRVKTAIAALPAEDRKPAMERTGINRAPQIFSAFERQIRDGIFIADDFGLSVDPAISRSFSRTSFAFDRCAP